MNKTEKLRIRFHRHGERFLCSSFNKKNGFDVSTETIDLDAEGGIRTHTG